MIKILYIKNFVLIDEQEIGFDKGLNVLTGETGSGKSIIIDAIDLAFGTRATKDQIKTGTDKAYIELHINLDDSFPVEILENNGIDLEDKNLIISREITHSSTRSRLNGVLVTQNYIQSLKKYLLDIHTQHESYNYIQPSTHIELLDNYGHEKYGNLLNNYRECFNELKNRQNELEKLQTAARENEQKVDFLKFQIKEIKNANILNINEFDELMSQRSILINSEELKELTFSGYSALYSEDQSITDVLNSIENKIVKAAEFDENLSEIAQMISSSTINLKEAAAELRNYSESLETDPEKLHQIEERIEILEKLNKKYGPQLCDVLQNLEKFEFELNEICFSDEKINELKFLTKDLSEKADKLAQELSSSRKKLAVELSDLIQKELLKLEMPKTQFCVEVKTANELTNNGYDSVEFLISPNTGEPLKPLAKIASGGEISRIMLAIKSIFARSDRVNTVIFDEIDSGISGKTSQSVADAFAGLSLSHQIICITHQPIIAAMADWHIYIEKIQDEKTTRVIIKTLDENSRIAAIAGLASGSSDDRDSINFAQKLLTQAAETRRECKEGFTRLKLV